MRLWKVQHALSFDLDALQRALGVDADETRLRALRVALDAEPASWEGEIVAGLLDATTPQARRARVNEALHDAARLLGWGSALPKAAPRSIAAATLCVLFWTLARQTLSPPDVLPVLAWGAAGVITSLALAREANHRVVRQRASVDRWVDQLLIASS